MTSQQQLLSQNIKTVQGITINIRDQQGSNIRLQVWKNRWGRVAGLLGGMLMMTMRENKSWECRVSIMGSRMILQIRHSDEYWFVNTSNDVLVILVNL